MVCLLDRLMQNRFIGKAPHSFGAHSSRLIFGHERKRKLFSAGLLLFEVVYD